MNTTTIFLFVVVACVGAAIGALLQRSQNRRSAPPPAQAESPEAPPVDKPVSAGSSGDVELLRAWRTQSGKVWLEMDGARLNEKESLKPEQRRRLAATVGDLRPWLETTPPESPAASIQPRLAVQPVPQVKKGKLTAEQAKSAAPVLKSIVQQIEDVLQAKLLTGPFKDRDIHLAEGPGGEVLVIDGLIKYEGIDAVPDPEIKSLIRQSITDWEKGSR